MPSTMIRPTDFAAEPEPFILDLSMDDAPVAIQDVANQDTVVALPVIDDEAARAGDLVASLDRMLEMSMTTTPIVVENLITWA